MSIRFNMEREADRLAWEHLQSIDTSKNRAVIDAINAFFESGNSAIQDVIRNTIRDCLKNTAFVQTSETVQPSTISEEESDLLDSLDDLLGG